jgi:hypothetical protein
MNLQSLAAPGASGSHGRADQSCHANNFSGRPYRVKPLALALASLSVMVFASFVGSSRADAYSAQCYFPSISATGCTSSGVLPSLSVTGWSPRRVIQAAKVSNFSAGTLLFQLQITLPPILGGGIATFPSSLGLFATQNTWGPYTWGCNPAGSVCQMRLWNLDGTTSGRNVAASTSQTP